MQFAPGFSNIESPRPAMFGQYVSGGIIHNDGSSSWLQVPPSQMPWGIPMADQPAIVRFTAESALMKSPDPGSFAQAKRKMDEEEVPLPTKQHITEEKMAAHFNQMHISQDYVAHEQQEPPKEDEQQHLKRLVLCEELRKLKQEPILPSSILARLEKPTMALVLWQPPAGTVNQALRPAANREEDNNNTSAVDLNSITSPGFPSTSSDTLDSMMDL